MTKKFVFTGRFEDLYLKIVSCVPVDFHIQLYNNKNLKNGLSVHMTKRFF